MEGNPLHMDLGAAQGSWISRTPARHQPWIGSGGSNTDYPFQETTHVTHPPDLSQFGAVDYRSHWMTDLNHGGPVQATTPSQSSSGGNAGRYSLDSHWTSVSCEDLLAYTAMDAASLYSQINGRLQPVGGNRGGGGQLLLNGRIALSQMSQYQRVEGFPVRLNPNPLEYDLNALPENKDNDVLLPAMRTTGQVSAPVTPEKRIQMQQRLPEVVSHEHFSFLTQEKQIQQPQQRLPEALRHEHISFLTPEKQSQQPQQRSLEASVEQEHIGLLMHLGGVTVPDPTQLSIQENQAAGKEDAEQINLNKTPQQKHPRRRKYMPKVVKEGKKPRSRKVNTEGTPKTPKRKYVRRADKTTEAIASGSVLDEATTEEGPPRQGRPVKRSLNFDSETRGNPHVDGFSIGALSPVRLGQGVEVVLERSPRGFAFDLNSYMTRMIDDYIGSPSANTSSVPQTDSRKQQGREKLKDIARQKNVKSDDVNGDIQRQPTTLAEAHFQLMQVNKRRRTEKIYIDLTNETTSNCGSTVINNNIECVWSANHVESPNQEVQSRGISNQMNLLSTPNQMDGTKKRRSKAPTRPRNLSSLTFSLDCKQNPLENVIVGEPQACVEALKVVNAKLKTRRRTKKGGQSSGANFLALVPYTDPIEELIKKLALLDINTIENAMVPYIANGTMVPFQPVKKRRPRARVILDDETLRLHKHLMLKASGDGSETMDEEKARWWEKEREIFRRRTDSFIRRMHEIQGDRTFSPWKGSVVDSVVGVFLTQNVSDHLSSSAFMALAARFPLRRQDMTEVPNAEEVSTSVEPQQISIVELDSPTNESLCQGSCSQECMVRQEGEITEVGDSVVCRISKEKGLPSSPENRRDMRVTVMESTSVTEAEDSRSLDGISSQNSVISSQNSSEYPIVIADRMGSSSESNSEVEDLLTGNSGFESSMTSFMDLLQMAGNGNFKDLYANGYRSCAEETSVTAAHQLNFPGGPQRNFSFDLNNIQCGSQSTSMFNSPLMRESANSKDALNVSYNSYHLHSSMQPGKFDMENVGSFQEVSRSLPSAASELTVHNNKVRICGLSAGNTSIATAPYVQQTPQTAPASNLHSLTSTGKDAKNEVHPPSHSGLCCERTLAISENNTEPVCPGSQVSRTVNIHQKEREPNVHVEGTRKTEYTNLLEGLAQRKDNVPADHTSTLPNHSGKSLEGNSKIIQNHEHSERKESDSLSKDVAYSSRKIDTETPKRNVKGKKITDETEKMAFDWDSLRREACCGSLKKERNRNTMDSLDWEAVRTAPVEEISNTIRERGMNNMLAERIKAFLNRVVQDHGSIDLEWLREVPPDKVKEYLLSIRGLGLKSVECVRLLTLHHLAFPVDTNVGRICVRLGWVPLEPLPESLQLHLLEMYPILESIQKYLWPRLCTLDQRTLYELHYQLITFGKVFCTKSKPNCNACPLKMECKHFASAFASARLALPGPEDKSLVTSTVPFADGQSQKVAPNQVGVPQLEGIPFSLERSAMKTCEPIIEEPTTPEPPEPERIEEVSENDIEEAFWQEDPDEIPPIVQDYEALKQNIQSIIESSNMDIENSDLSKALVALTPAAASIPMPKLKNVNRLRTEHRVYELPDTHPLLKGMDHREPDDPCSYLLAIWTPGETAQSFQPPETCCNSKETGALCHNETCFSCKSIQEANSHTVRGTLLIPCRTAMRGSFPLNGTYFQVNEVFADHDSSQNPIIVPRKLIWNLPRRTVYFGTSVPSIFKGLRTEEIQHCFWRGFVCVRGFDQKTRAPRPLVARLHFPASKVIRGKRTQAKEE